MIPLTLRAMNRTRHRPGRSSARLFFALPLVLALLALVSFPVGQAVGSELPEYEDAPPEVPAPKPHHESKPEKESESSAHSSNTGGGTSAGGGSGGSNTGGGESVSEGSSEGSGDNPSTAGSGGTGKDNGSKAATDHQNKGAEANTTISAPVESDDSSSSPLAPILIAIAVLAAISIGVVVIKQRRQRRGPDGAISPKAS